MATWNQKGYDSYSGCDIVVTARLATLNNSTKKIEEKIYTLGSIQTLSVSTHQDKKPVRVIGSMNALDYTMGQRTIAGSLVFAVFDQHFATEMFNDLKAATGKSFFLPDELPALDITITFANEYGRTSRMAIYGVRIINEGQVMSINDLYTENTYQFVATAMEPLKRSEGDTGGGSDKDNEAQVASVFDLVDTPAAFSGEEVWNNSFADNQNLNRILLTATTEQPMFEYQEGIVKFTLSPNQNSGIIYILNQIQNKVVNEIHIENKNIYTAYLESGLYSAWYEDKGQTLSNTVIFSIDSAGSYSHSYNDSPIVDSVTETSISISCNNPTHTKGVCSLSSTKSSIELDLKSRKCTFTNLESNTTYVIYTKNETGISNVILVKTLAEEENYTEGFKTYARYNRTLLSNDIDKYEVILEKLNNNNDIINTLEKEQSIEAKELLFMAVKYKNEFTSVINHNAETMPQKDLNNVYGNSFKFNTGTTKANIFLTKGKKEFYEYSQQYPVEMTYSGKSNRTYNVVAITNDFVKSPKYTFYSYSDNDKSKINDVFGEINKLANIDLTVYMNSNKRYPDIALKCLAVSDNKNIDIKLLKAPTVHIDENCNLIANVNYKDVLGERKSDYYLVISELNQALDKTPNRKIKIEHTNNHLLVNNYMTAINSKDTYAVWIEDDKFNIVSEVNYVSLNEEVISFNSSIIEDKVNDILSKTGVEVNKDSITDISTSVIGSSTSDKDMHYDIIKAAMDLKISNEAHFVFEVLKHKFNSYYVNQDKYRTVSYNNQEIQFNNMTNGQLVHIGFKKEYGYEINVIESNKTLVNTNDYAYNLYYVIDNNSIIKSGFVLIDNKQVKTHLIRLEEL